MSPAAADLFFLLMLQMSYLYKYNLLIYYYENIRQTNRWQPLPKI